MGIVYLDMLSFILGKRMVVLLLLGALIISTGYTEGKNEHRLPFVMAGLAAFLIYFMGNGLEAAKPILGLSAIAFIVQRLRR